MDTNIRVLKSSEIQDDLWTQISFGYEKCFNLKISPSILKTSFCNTITGYTLHAIKISTDGQLMGHNYFQPRPYILNGEKVICALSGGTFVMPDYRKDIFIFKDLFNILCKEAKKLGWIAQIGVPNENSFQYCLKIIKEKYIGDLNYYILPVHLAKTLRYNNNILNRLSSLYATTLSKINYFVSSKFNIKGKKVQLSLDDNSEYLKIRLSDPYYKKIQKDDLTGAYRIYDEDGIITAYILHFGQSGKKTTKSLAYVVNYILKYEKIDAIIYIGTMHLAQWLLSRVPKKYVPHKLPVSISIFNNDNMEVIEACSSLSNLDYGLINFDVR